MNLFTVILYGTDSDGDPDVQAFHVRTKGRSREDAEAAARRQHKRSGGDPDRFHGTNPFVYAGHLEELSNAKN